jgi:hypothetical protein
MLSVFQLKIFRAIAGGVWVNVDGIWKDVREIRIDDDGTEILVIGINAGVSRLIRRDNTSVFGFEIHEM